MGVETILPKISIVTPSFNQGMFLEKTILSVLEQGYPNLEYIIIDGGSTDESVEIIRKYADRLTYWVSESDRGQSHAINKGFERATGEIFGWLNSDDWYHPGALQAVAEAFAANPEAGAVVGAGEMVDEEGNIILYLDAPDVTVELLYHWIDKFFWQPSCFFTSKVWQDCGPLNEEFHFAMDLDFWLRIAREYSYGVTPANLSSSLRHETAKTTACSYMSFVEVNLIIMQHGGIRDSLKYLGDYVKYLFENNMKNEAYLVDRDRQIHDKNVQLVSQVRQIEEMGTLLNDKLKQVDALEKKNVDLLNSLSWRVTAPLRDLNNKWLEFRRR